MQKIILSIFFLFFLTISTKAQTNNKGKFAIGVSNSMKDIDDLREDFLSQIDQPSNGNSYQFDINTSPHYYISNRIALGLGFNSSISKDSGETDNISFNQTFNLIQYGPYLRYLHSKSFYEIISYKIFKNMYPYIDANYNFGSATYKQELTGTDSVNDKYELSSYAISSGLMYDFDYLRGASSKLVKLLSYLYLDFGFSYSSLNITPKQEVDTVIYFQESGVNFRFNLGMKF